MVINMNSKTIPWTMDLSTRIINVSAIKSVYQKEYWMCMNATMVSIEMFKFFKLELFC